VVSFTFVVVASCWSSSGDIESSVLLLLHARTHLKQTKKKIAPVIRVVVLTRKVHTEHSLKDVSHSMEEGLQYLGFLLKPNNYLSND
jgi:hypothetical protein